MKLAAIRAPGQDAVQKSLTTLHAAVAQHIVQGRKDLLVRQVSGGAKKDESVSGMPCRNILCVPRIVGLDAICHRIQRFESDRNSAPKSTVQT